MEPHDSRHYCVIGDYCLNILLLNLGEEQAGDTYYMSPKNVHCFGIADVTLEKARLHAYMYQEEMGNKGSNNVASLVIKHLFDEDVIIPGRTGGKLTLVFDNCPGQNNNNHALRLANYLVELGYFKEI